MAHIINKYVNIPFHGILTLCPIGITCAPPASLVPRWHHLCPAGITCAPSASLVPRRHHLCPIGITCAPTQYITVSSSTMSVSCRTVGPVPC